LVWSEKVDWPGCFDERRVSVPGFEVVGTLPIGVEVAGRLSSIGTGSTTQLKDLLLEHRLLVFHGQDLSHEGQVAVAAQLGPVPQDVGESLLSTTGRLGAGELVFHSDLAFDPHPHLAVTLHALDISPEAGTSTNFVDCIEAYRMLDPDLRARVDDLYALHVFPLSTTERMTQARADHYPRAVHPVAWAHPSTGHRALYVNSQATVGIVGLTKEESDDLISGLFEVLYERAPRYEHRWHTGDVLLWDNRALQHARDDQNHMESRVLRRVIVDYLTFDERYGAFLASDSVSLRRDPALEKV
jgi:taurine dioxygenase